MKSKNDIFFTAWTWLCIIYEEFGSPRSWQLGGELILRRLDPESLTKISGWAKSALDGTLPDHLERIYQPRQRYFVVEIVAANYGDFRNPLEIDLWDVETAEKKYWDLTMPVEFLESLARLS